MRILVISDVPWSDDNSVGNTYSNVFRDMENVEFANLFCKPGKPNSENVKRYYQITEKKILQNLFKKDSNKYISVDTKIEDTMGRLNKKEQRFYDLLRNLRFPSLFIVREFIWKFGNWKTKELDKFLEDFKPDIIFSFCIDSVYYSNIIEYCRIKTESNIVLFFADDVYTYKRFNPLYTLHQYFIRRSITKLANHSQLIYGATPELCVEYSKILNTELLPLHKICYDIIETKTIHNMPMKMTYTGNLFYGRWKVLALLSDAINEINKESSKIFLEVFTTGLCNKKMVKSLNNSNASCLRKGISYTEVKRVLKESDIVVHVESFERKEIKKTRLSFSTKIVDCIQSGSCMLAIGPAKLASISMLREHDIAEVITTNSRDDIKAKLENLLENNKNLFEKSEKMKEYGFKYHTSEYLRINLYNKLDEIVKR